VCEKATQHAVGVKKKAKKKKKKRGKKMEIYTKEREKGDKLFMYCAQSTRVIFVP